MRSGIFRNILLSLAAIAAVVVMGASSLAAQNIKQGPGSAYKTEKSPSLIDPAGPTISLTNSETLFTMAAALNACGYDDGLSDSEPVRKGVRDQMQQALNGSEKARASRDKLCLYIAQHRMTGTVKDVAQYISLSLYLTPPPELETAAELPDMPTDATQVMEVLPLLREFASSADLHSIWLGVHHAYEDEVTHLHDPLSAMIVDTNLYLKMPASTYDGRRFLVLVEPLLAPGEVNARVYGQDYVVIVSPHNGEIRMTDVHHTYLHYVIDPLLLQRSTAMDRMLPILKEVRDSPMEFTFRSDIVALTIECLIKAIEARTMDTGIPVFKIPDNVPRSEYAKFDEQRQQYQKKVDVVREARVAHQMHQGFVLTQYFYQQLLLFEKDPASLKDTIGEMVYGMDVEQQVHVVRRLDFDKQADEDVLRRSMPHKLDGLDLAESKLASNDIPGAVAIAKKALDDPTQDTGRASFILARAAIATGHPDDAMDGFQKAVEVSKDPRILSWSHIYLGRMYDLECRREDAVGEYKMALVVRDSQQDTRLAAERGVKQAYAVSGHVCEAGDDDKVTPPSQSSHPTTGVKSPH